MFQCTQHLRHAFYQAAGWEDSHPQSETKQQPSVATGASSTYLEQTCLLQRDVQPLQNQNVSQAWNNHRFAPNLRLGSDRSVYLHQSEVEDGYLVCDFIPSANCINLGTETDLRQMPAHPVPLEGTGLPRKMHFILSQTPNEQSLDAFLEMLQKQASALVILETSKYNYIRDLDTAVEIDDTQHHFSVIGSVTYKGIEEVTLRVTNQDTQESRDIAVIIANEWPDMGTDPRFNEIVALAKKAEQHASTLNGYSVVVHCTAGVGRSGSLACAVALDHLIDSQTVTTPQQLLDAQVKITEAGKQERGPGFIMREAQFQMVYANGLLRLKDHETPVVLPSPATVLPENRTAPPLPSTGEKRSFDPNIYNGPPVAIRKCRRKHGLHVGNN